MRHSVALRVRERRESEEGGDEGGERQVDAVAHELRKEEHRRVRLVDREHGAVDGHRQIEGSEGEGDGHEDDVKERHGPIPRREQSARHEDEVWVLARHHGRTRRHWEREGRARGRVWLWSPSVASRQITRLRTRLPHRLLQRMRVIASSITKKILRCCSTGSTGLANSRVALRAWTCAVPHAG